MKTKIRLESEFSMTKTDVRREYTIKIMRQFVLCLSPVSRKTST